MVPDPQPVSAPVQERVQVHLQLPEQVRASPELDATKVSYRLLANSIG